MQKTLFKSDLYFLFKIRIKCFAVKNINFCGIIYDCLLLNTN